MAIVTGTYVHVFGSYTWRPPAKIRGEAEWEGRGMLLAPLVVCTPITTSYDREVALNLSTSTTGEGRAVSQTTPKARGHTPAKHVNIYVLVMNPKSSQRERLTSIYYTSQAHCLGAVWVKTSTFTQIITHSCRCNYCSPYTESDPPVTWPRSCPSVAKENLFGEFKSLKNNKVNI